jgi:DNA-binding PadR family transcriptional regulator
VLLHLKEPPPRESGRSEVRKKAALPEVAYLILGYVAMHPEGVHGYQLGRTLSRPPLRVPSLRLGHLYRLLRRLEQAGLVACTVEAETTRLRYRFSITPDGEATFREWWLHPPRSGGLTRDHVLERLRFADRLPSRDVLRLIDGAVRACESESEAMARHGRAGEESCDALPEIGARIYLMARKARLADDRCWLEEVRRLVERGAGESATPNDAADERTSG